MTMVSFIYLGCFLKFLKNYKSFEIGIVSQFFIFWKGEKNGFPLHCCTLDIFISVCYLKRHFNISITLIKFFEKFELYLIFVKFSFSSSFGINWYQMWPYFWAFLRFFPKFKGIKVYKIRWLKFLKNSIRLHVWMSKI